jgi:phosphate transport system permease protein
VPVAPGPRHATSFTSPKARQAHKQEQIALVFLKGAAAFVIVAMAFLVGYLGEEGTKTFFVDHVSPLTFLFSPTYAPDTKSPGSLVFIIGSISITLFAIVVGGPIGVAVGVFLSELAPAKMAAILKPSIELLVGIPSVVYGWLGLTLLVPLIRNVSGSSGFGLAAAGIVLSIMILPTVITLSEDALKAVSPFLREGSMALGATRWETIWRVVLPTAKSGLAVAIILGIARAIGETLAVQMVIGNSATIPTGLFSATAALPTEIVIDMAGASQGSPLQHTLFSMAFLLLLIAMMLILGVKFALRKRG